MKKLLSMFALLTMVSLPILTSAQGNNFYHCTRKDGTEVITNRHQSDEWVRCRPFELNRDFKTAEERRRVEPLSARSERDLEEAAYAARASAEAARVSAEAARSAAAAAREAAEAAGTAAAVPPPQTYPYDWMRY